MMNGPSSALLLFSLTFACQNSGGKVLGASGVDIGTGTLDGGFKIIVNNTCEIPCETIEDCRKFKPHVTEEYGQIDISFAWKDCANGACTDVECVTEADCAENPYPDRGGTPCTENQCAPPCTNGKCLDPRDKCIDGRCMRQPEVPDPNCEGSICGCFGDSDCDPWSACRDGNMCRPYQSAALSNASGRTCEKDADCGAYYLEQDMLAAGLNANLMNSWSFCTQAICGDDPDNPYTWCGEGFTCIDVTNVEPDQYGYVPERTVCVPDDCAAGAGCDPSYSECTFDKDCPSGETCTWPWGYCRGVCLDLECSKCSDWTKSHRTRACISRETKVWLDGGTAEEVEVPISVRRPD